MVVRGAGSPAPLRPERGEEHLEAEREIHGLLEEPLAWIKLVPLERPVKGAGMNEPDGVKEGFDQLIAKSAVKGDR
jgi:hypothetical protein